MEGKPAQDAFNILNAVLGIALALSPRVVGFGDETASWHACVLGVAVTLAATSALVMFFRWEEWLVMGLGTWLVAAPWALGFTAHATAMRVHIISGVAVAAIAAIELWLARRTPERLLYRRARVR
jgi:hypothetical protein